jgi:hypothetical protein
MNTDPISTINTTPTINPKYKTQIVLFYFNLTRKHNHEDLQHSATELENILISLKEALYECDDTVEIQTYISYFVVLYKLIAYTRDIYLGKGERDLTYMMITIWYKYFPIPAENILETVIHSKYGSWKDLKYFCRYLQTQTQNQNQTKELISKCIQLWNHQLEIDQSTKDPKDRSLVYKWIPREKSAFGWLYEKSVIQWYSNKNMDIQDMNYAKKSYRQIISSLSREKEEYIPQIKECQNKWSEISPEKISVTTRSKQYHTFIKHNTNHNRKPTKPPHPSPRSFHLGDYIKDPHSQNQKYWNQIKTDILKTHQTTKPNIIPVLNISIIHPEEYNHAVGIALMISEISNIENRILTYDTVSSWLNLSNQTSLQDKITYIQKKTILKGISNVKSAINLLEESKLTEEGEDIILVFISDFSREPTEISQYTSQYKTIYWNIGSNPTKIQPQHPNQIMVSGYSSSILKFIYNNPIYETTETNTESSTAYGFLYELLNQDQYNNIEEYFTKLITIR